MFRPAYNITGGPIAYQEMPVASATTLTKGQVVQISTAGVGIISMAAPTDADDPVVGVTAEASAAGEAFVKVYTDPNIVFEAVNTRYETVADSGDATSWVDATLTLPDDRLIGGHIVITDTNSITGFEVGDILTITDFANSGGDCTVTGAGGTIAAGITGWLYLGKGSIGYYGFDLDSGADDLNLASAGGELMQIHDVVVNSNGTSKVFVKLRLHEHGNSVVAI